MNHKERVLLLCDVVDSTALTELLGDARSMALWRAHDSTARDLLADWRGREVDKTDGLFAIFDCVVDALGFATAYHEALAAMDPPLQARAAIHRAAVLLRETPAADVARGAKPLDVDGIAKPLTARIGALALSGQTLISETAATALADAQGLIPLGHWRFKGVSEPMALFEPAAQPLGPPPDAEKAWRVTRAGERWLPTRDVPHSLPAERDGFVGRRPALAELAAFFADGARLVTVLGVGGTGKTCWRSAMAGMRWAATPAASGSATCRKRWAWTASSTPWPRACNCRWVPATRCSRSATPSPAAAPRW